MTGKNDSSSKRGRGARMPRSAVAAAAVGLGWFGAAALADQAGPGAQAPVADLQEVVVTAEKRVSTVQKTPISVTAITGSDLQAQGVTDFLTVAQQVPGISFKTSGPGQTEF